MKKIYILTIALLFCFGAYAQIARSSQTIIPVSPASIPTHNHSSAGIGTSHLWLEYDSADADPNHYDTPQTHTIQWVMNKRYPAGFVHNPYNYTFQYYVVKFDSLYDLNTENTIANSDVNNITVDSIYALIGHSNTTGTYDTLVVKILGLTPAHYPDVNNILWADTTRFNYSLSPDDYWESPVFVKWNPNFSMTKNGFAVEVDYYGSMADTCAFLVGFDNAGAANPINACGAYRANQSNFYPNSFAVWTDNIPPFPSLSLIPDSTGLDIELDCNGDHTFDPTVDSYNYIQDIVMGAYITINEPTGIADFKNTGIGLSQNVPNPLHGATEIKYSLVNDSKDVTLYVYDLVGSQVMEINEGSRSQGKYSITLDATKLAKGIYTYTLRADGSQLTKRMVIE